MPQPISPTSSSVPLKVVLNRANLAAYIGAIAAEWTHVEDQLMHLLATAFGSSARGVNGEFGINLNWIAKAAIEETETIRVRLKIMDVTLGALVKGKSVEAEWGSLRNNLQKRSTERNRIVHGQWALSDEYPDALLLRAKDEQTLLYKERDFSEILDRIVSVRQACIYLQQNILNAIHDGEIGERPMGPRRV